MYWDDIGTGIWAPLVGLMTSHPAFEQAEPGLCQQSQTRLGAVVLPEGLMQMMQEVWALAKAKPRRHSLRLQAGEVAQHWV